MTLFPSLGIGNMTVCFVDPKYTFEFTIVVVFLNITPPRTQRFDLFISGLKLM